MSQKSSIKNWELRELMECGGGGGGGGDTQTPIPPNSFYHHIKFYIWVNIKEYRDKLMADNLN